MDGDGTTRRRMRKRIAAAVALASLAATSGTIVAVAFWPVWPFKGGHLEPTNWGLDGVDGRELIIYVNLSRDDLWGNECLGRLDVEEAPTQVEITAYRRVGGHHCSRKGCVRVTLREPLGGRRLFVTYGPDVDPAKRELKDPGRPSLHVCGP